MKIKALSGAESSHNGNFLTSGSDIHFTSHNPHSNVKIMKRKEGDRQITLHDNLIGYEDYGMFEMYIRLWNHIGPILRCGSPGGNKHKSNLKTKYLHSKVVYTTFS